MADQQEPNTDEAADSADAHNQQNPNGTTTADHVDKDDPQKVQKLTDPDGDRNLDEAEE